MLKLQRKSIEWAIKSITRHSDTFIFPEPFEIDAIVENKKDVVDYISSLDIFKEGIRPYRTTLTPKGPLGFRISTQLDPIDSIITQSIIFEIAKELESQRIDKIKDIIYSFRLEPQQDGFMYNRKYNWSSFYDKAESIIKKFDPKYILSTDISNFFPSIYLHNIETVLYDAVKKSGKNAHVQVLINYLKAMHLNQTHKGIPVGPQFARPIAELILNEVDCILLDKKIKYIRYLDDYIFFCHSETHAYAVLAFLAQQLYNSRNLKLNEQKTEILKTSEFVKKYIRSHEDKEKERLINDFNVLLVKLGIDTDTYEDIDIADMSETDLKKIRGFNLEQIFKDELVKDAPDLGLVSFLLNNLARIDNTDVAEIILRENNIKKLFPKLRVIINYLYRVRSFSQAQKSKIGNLLVTLLEGSFVNCLPFNRMWLINIFTKSDEWDNETKFRSFLNKYTDPLTVRELYLALGRSHNIKYFRENKNISLNMDPWLKRAFIASMSCLPEPERNPWFKSRSLTHRDFLDMIVEAWAQKNHF